MNACWKCGRLKSRCTCHWRLTIAAAVMAFALSGCAALSRGDEQTWQALHVVDAVQTNRIVGDPCYAEGHALTRDLVGAEPTHARVLAWAVGGAAVHAGVTEGLLDLNLPRVATAWEWVSLADTGYSIEQGWKVGVRIGSPNTRTLANGCGAGAPTAHGDVLLSRKP